MKQPKDIRCRLGWHHWGPIVGDRGESRRQCFRCGRVQRIDAAPRPPDQTMRSGHKWHQG